MPARDQGDQNVYVIDANTAFGKRTEFDYDLSLPDSE